MNDEYFLNRCFRLALKGAGQVSPNPMVGSVIVKDGQIAGEGYHKRFGEAHAEKNAIADAGNKCEGATLYCNLEPCSHTNKKTPPCVPAIIKAGISEVVVSNVDPNPAVSGEGLRQLKAAGIKVRAGILEEKGAELNRFFFKHIREKKPWITIKIAQSLDGRLTKQQNRQTWITGEESGKFVHSLRAAYDAALIGSNTVIIDDPQLNVRHVEGRNPLRIVLDAMNESPTEAKMFHDEGAPVWVFHPEKYKDKAKRLKNVKYHFLPADEKGFISPSLLIEELGKKGISSLLIEGGAKIFSSFISQAVFDEIIILIAPKIFGSGITILNSEYDGKLQILSQEKLGDDLKLVIRKK